MRVPAGLADKSWRDPIIAGLGSIPVTLLLQWHSVGDYVFVPVLFAGILVGYLCAGRRTSSRRVGWRTGLVGGLALVWGGVRFAMLIPEYPHTVAVSVLAGLLTVLAVGFYLVVYGVIGAIGAIAGGWLADRIDGSRSSFVGAR